MSTQTPVASPRSRQHEHGPHVAELRHADDGHQWQRAGRAASARPTATSAATAIQNPTCSRRSIPNPPGAPRRVTARSAATAAASG